MTAGHLPAAAVNHSTLIARLTPAIVVQLYLNATLFVFVFGPWTFPVLHPKTLYTFVLAAHAALLIGNIGAATRRAFGYVGRTTPERLLRISGAVSFLLVFPTSLLFTGHLVPDVVTGLTSPGDAYAVYQASRVSSTPLAAYARMLFGPILALPLPLTLFYWRSVSRLARGLGILAVLGNIALGISMGVNRGIILPIVLAPIYMAFAAAAGRWRPTRAQILGAAVGSCIAIAAALTFFTAATTQREGSGLGTGTFARIDARADPDNVMTRYVPDGVAIGVFGISMYVGQGYYGLSLAMDKPFRPMYGVGHSSFLYRQVARVTGNEEWEHNSYPERISDEDDWPVVQLFQTIYPWIASDVTFPGTIIVVFGIGWLFGALCRDTLRGDNPYAIALLGQVILMLLYFPALNAVLEDGEGLAAFWGLLLAWTFTKRPWLLYRRLS